MKIADIITEAADTSKAAFGKESKILDFGKSLEKLFHGFGASLGFYPGRRRWSRFGGGAVQDPTYILRFKNREDRDDAWQELMKHGKQVHTTDPFSSSKNVLTFIRVGKFLLQKDSLTYDALSNKPRAEYFLSIRTASALRNPSVQKLDITDAQAAALHDIAKSRSADALEKIKAVLDWEKAGETVKQALDTTNKLSDKDKSTIDSILAGTKNFREPD